MIVMEYAQHTWRLPLPSNKHFLKPKLLPRATSENLVDLCSTGSSFMDPSNSFHMLDEINNVDDEGTYLLTSLRIGLRDAFSNATSSCLNDERWLAFTTLLTATITRLY